VRHQETIICGGCKANICLVDHLEEYRKAKRQIRKALEEFTRGLSDITINIKCDMDSDYVQHVRYKLQKRLKRLNTDDLNGIHWVLVQTWAFLQENAITKGILDDLERRLPEAEKHAEEIVATEKTLVGTTETEHVAISYWVLKKCLASGQTDYAMQIGNRFGGDGLSGYIESFRENYIEPLFDYLDEQIDDKRMTLHC